MPTPDDARTGGGIQSIHVAARVIEEVQRAGEVGVSDLARALGMPKSSAQRYVSSLHDVGWLVPARAAAGRQAVKWRVGPGLISVGVASADRLGVRALVSGVASELVARTSETVLLSIPEQDGPLVIERYDSPLPLRIMTPLGEHMPYASSAAGLALLSAMAEADASSVLARHAPARAAGGIEAELARTRARGYSINQGLWSAGVSAVSSAVLDRTGAPVAALSVTAPSSRFSTRQLRETGELVARLSRSVSGILR
jgi:IclR family acetate operon transcriptional repressor